MPLEVRSPEPSDPRPTGDTRTEPSRRPRGTATPRHVHLGVGLLERRPSARDPYVQRRERRRRAAALAAALRDLGVEASLLTDRSERAAERPALPAVQVGPPRRPRLPLGATLRHTLGDPDAVLHLHVDGPQDLGTLAAAGLAHRGRTVVHLHGAVARALRTGGEATLAGLVGAPVEGRLVRRADVVAVGSPRLADELRSAGARNVLVLPPAATEPPRDLPVPPARPWPDVPGPRIVAVGPLTPRRRSSALVGALGRLPSSTNLVLLGTGPDRLAIDRAAHREGVADRVHVVPTASWATVTAHLAHADVVASAALVGEDPAELLLAARLGRPVVTTAVEGLPLLFRDRVDGRVVPPLDDEALVAALHETLTDPPAAAERAASAHRRTLARGWDVVARELLDALAVR
ncbi:glycosyltransferase family 4 protein [Nitriliruptoraceae bacterium ZYF776]|nr:glycosyltransferase family 4 protein [Profundirhabdus halotolerans]